MGVPPFVTAEAVTNAVAQWAQGTARFETWDEIRERCRPLAAGELAVPQSTLAMIPSVVPAVAYVGDQLARRKGVVVAHRSEFRSLLLPLLRAFGEERIRWVDGPYTAATFLEGLDEGAAVVAVSSASSHNGARPGLAAIHQECQSVGTELVIDSTQTTGITSLGVDPAQLALVACAGYKGLLAPRGTGYSAIREDLSLAAPALASPYGMSDTPQVGSYGGPLMPREGGARLDQSPAWLSWVGAHASLQFLQQVPLKDREAHVLGMTAQLRHRLQGAGYALAETDLPSPVVALTVPDPAAALTALEEAGIRASVRRGVLRMGFHLYVEPSVIETVVDVLNTYREAGE
ncbi:aminotransferase class V-fold PLP-dependent enzyme [Nesterenkonia haasae]|uniref:aminotransferase class V-fold PLP-dependent enzyme n=1 Tax=Nesterenkonia haasae TaxID=2587813 RepID=UPI00139074E7|nr:aminotransferase class V-fold PLP-dependent enzyme [Nesterenkonia haasae]